MKNLSSYIQTLRHPVVARLTLIQFISYFGMWFSQVAIASMMVAYGASEMEIASLFMMISLPAILLAPLTGYIIDRFPFKTLMQTLLIIEMSMTLLFMTIDSLEDIPWLMLFLFIRSMASSILFSAEMALFPKILEGEMLKNTNEIHSVVWSVCFALGMAMGGMVTYHFGYDTTFIIDVILYLTASMILLGLKLSLKPSIPQSAMKMMQSGFNYLRKHHKLIHLILLHAVVALTSFDTIVTLLADHYYQQIIAVPLAIGWINTTRAIGLSMGPLIFGHWINQSTLHYALLLQGLSIILWSFVQKDYYLSLSAIFFVGLFSTTIWSYTYYLLQQEINPSYLGRVIAYNDMIFMGTSILVTLFVGYCAKAGIALQQISMMLGIGFILMAGYYVWLKKRYFTQSSKAI